MRRLIPGLLLLTSLSFPGCSEPLKDDEAHKILETCCESARERVTSVKDVESDRFREYCRMCRQGRTKSDCSHGAGRALRAVAKAYSADMLPLGCNTMHEQMKAIGIEFAKPE